MNLQTKKIIAREFLVLTLCFFLGLIAFLCTYLFNFYKHNQVDNLRIKIESKKSLEDSLSKSFEFKRQNQKWFYNQMSEKYDIGKLNSVDLWWEHSEHLAKTDSIKERWKTIWSKDPDPIPFFKKLGFDTPDSLQNFIKANSFNENDVKNNQTAKQIKEDISLFAKQEKENQLNILTAVNQNVFGFTSFLISIFIFFILRYFYYAAKWSIKTLKKANKENDSL